MCFSKIYFCLCGNGLTACRGLGWETEGPQFKAQGQTKVLVARRTCQDTLRALPRYPTPKCSHKALRWAGVPCPYCKDGTGSSTLLVTLQGKIAEKGKSQEKKLLALFFPHVDIKDQKASLIRATHSLSSNTVVQWCHSCGLWVKMHILFFTEAGLIFSAVMWNNTSLDIWSWDDDT